MHWSSLVSRYDTILRPKCFFSPWFSFPPARLCNKRCFSSLYILTSLPSCFANRHTKLHYAQYAATTALIAFSRFPFFELLTALSIVVCNAVRRASSKMTNSTTSSLCIDLVIFIAHHSVKRRKRSCAVFATSCSCNIRSSFSFDGSLLYQFLGLNRKMRRASRGNTLTAAIVSRYNSSRDSISYFVTMRETHVAKYSLRSLRLLINLARLALKSIKESYVCDFWDNFCTLLLQGNFLRGISLV